LGRRKKWTGASFFFQLKDKTVVPFSAALPFEFQIVLEIFLHFFANEGKNAM
jgi:hypothetical protein